MSGLVKTKKPPGMATDSQNTNSIAPMIPQMAEEHKGETSC